jgi:cyclic dehypoxanthinyl futalosine synthase
MGISREEARDALRSDDLVGIGMEADAVRRRLHPENVVSYAVAARVDCTDGDPALVRQRAEETLSMGGSGIALANTGRLTLKQIVAVVGELRRGLPDAWISGLSAKELDGLATQAGADLAAVIARLISAGWNAPLSEAPAPSPDDKSELERWLGVHRVAHGAGLRTAAALQFGAGESLEQRLDTFGAIARLQEETGGFASFAPENASGGLHGPTAVECLKLVAVSRLLLEGIPSIEAGRATPRRCCALEPIMPAKFWCSARAFRTCARKTCGA